ncbi:MAG: hypothetical protein QOE70_3550 [Chthoniobacter sp.]|nr:hypothetical protein [Chthoniobacter sp.]
MGLLARAIDIFDKTPDFAPTITFSDHYSEKVVVDDRSRSVEAKPEAIALNIVANLVGANAGALNSATTVSVSAGYFSHDATLGESIDYKPGKLLATFPFFTETTLANGNTRMTRVGEIAYSWTATKLMIKVKCTDIEGAGLTDIAASDYVTDADTGTRVRIKDFADVSVSFGNASGSRYVYIDGIAQNDLKTFGAPTSAAYEELEVVDVNVKGTADQDGPEIVATYAPVVGTPRVFDATGTAADLTDVTLDEVVVNGVRVGPPAGTIVYDAVNDIWKWKVPGLRLIKGSNRIVLKFSDEELNVTTSTKTLVVP